MSWLALQIWIELLVAAAIGGVAVWAYLRWRPSFGVLAGLTSAPVAMSASGVTDPEGRVRIAELEGQVRLEREEAETLRRKLAAGSATVITTIATPVSDEAPVVVEDEGSLTWRNRFLESKVRFLEGKLADAGEATVAPEQPAPEENDEATRLRWRNRYLEGRVKYLEEELSSGGTLQVVMPAEIVPPAVAAAKAAVQPELLTAARNGRADDLKAISGIGPKLERLLNSIGVYHYDQIASWDAKQVDWVNAAISFRGRIERERWISQAQQLLHGDAEGKLKFGEGNGH